MKMQTQKPTLKEPKGYLLMLVLARMVFFGVDNAAAADDEDCDLNGDVGIADAVAVVAAAAASMTLSLTATKTMTTLNVML